MNRENREEVIFRDNKNFPELMKDTNLHIQETQLNPSEIKKKIKRLNSHLNISQRNYNAWKKKREREYQKKPERKKTKEQQTDRWLLNSNNGSQKSMECYF